MSKQWKVPAVVAMTTLGLAATPAFADMIYPGAAGEAPEGFALLLWAVVILPAACCWAGLLWLICFDRGKERPATRVQAGPAAAGGMVRPSF